MEKKYTVFVSSTQQDLRDERDAVSKAILELGHIPIGMEMFSAGDEQQWLLIQRQIDESDYYVVISAHRYGSMVGNVSYTEREYDYAIAKSVPTLAFIIADDASWPADRIDMGEEEQKRLGAFKAKLKTKIVSFWNSADQLNAKVLAALSKQFALSPRPGWVRAVDIPGPEVLSELSRLSRENSELRLRITSRPDPKFEVMFAGLIAHGAERRAHFIVLIHYDGSPIYLPSHRCQLYLDTTPLPILFKHAIISSSPLIHREGDDLQIEGSGYAHFISVETVSEEQLVSLLIVKLCLNLRLHADGGIVLSGELHAPEWRVGEAGVRDSM